MFKPTPNPPRSPSPSTPVTQALSFGHSPGDKLRLSVREDIPLENALGHASQHLSTAALTAFEVAGRCPPELQSLTHSIVHQLEIAKALVEASIAGINGRSSG